MVIWDEFGFLGTIGLVVIFITTVRLLLRLRNNNNKKELFTWLKVLATTVSVYFVAVILYALIFPD